MAIKRVTHMLRGSLVGFWNGAWNFLDNFDARWCQGWLCHNSIYVFLVVGSAFGMVVASYLPWNRVIRIIAKSSSMFYVENVGVGDDPVDKHRSLSSVVGINCALIYWVKSSLCIVNSNSRDVWIKPERRFPTFQVAPISTGCARRVGKLWVSVPTSNHNVDFKLDTVGGSLPNVLYSELYRNAIWSQPWIFYNSIYFSTFRLSSSQRLICRSNSKTMGVDTLSLKFGQLLSVKA